MNMKKGDWARCRSQLLTIKENTPSQRLRGTPTRSSTRCGLRQRQGARPTIPSGAQTMRLSPSLRTGKKGVLPREHVNDVFK